MLSIKKSRERERERVSNPLFKRTVKGLFTLALFSITLLSSAAHASAGLLIQQSDFTYQGAFYVPSPGTGCLGSYGTGFIAYNPPHRSLFITGGTVDTGCTGSQVGEIGIPAVLSSTTTSSYSSIPAATFLQTYHDITNGNFSNNGPGGTFTPKNLGFRGGLMLFDNNSTLLESSGDHYGTSPHTTEFLSFSTHGTDLSSTTTFSGMYGLNTSSNMDTNITERDSNVFVGSIPSGLQAQLGGSAFGGGGGYSIISTSSYGPSCVVFDPNSLGMVNAPAPPPDNRGVATALLYYPNGHTPAGWGTWGSATQPVTAYYGTADNVTGATFINNSTSLLFFGIHSTGSCNPLSGDSPTTTADCAPPIGNGNPANFGGYCYGLGTSDLSQQCTGSLSKGWGPLCVNGNMCGSTVMVENGTEQDTCCYDPGVGSKGQHEYPYTARAWAYDVGDSSGNNSPGNNVSSNVSNASATAGTSGNNPGENNLTAVKLGNLFPNDLYPYAMWQITLPWLPSNYQGNISPAYDSANGKLYLSFSLQHTSQYDRRPVVAVFDMSVSTTSSDTAAPSVTSFTLPSVSSSLTVPISAFTATDNTAVTGYLVNESSSIPTAGDAGWAGTAQATYTFISDGLKTLYAWAKDAAGNISTSLSASVTVDTTAPTTTAFTLPGTGSSRTIHITSFTATDNTAVTGYLVNESATPPSAGDSGWSATAPTSYTFASDGSKTLYAWAKDAAGNISTSLSASVTVDTSTPAPTTTTTPAPHGSISIPALGLPSTPNPLPGQTATQATRSTGLTSSQVTSILNVLTSFNVDPAVLANVSAILHGTTTPQQPTTPAASSFTFTRNLQLHQTGSDVTALQRDLNTHGFPVSATGPGSLNNETATFGLSTYRALVRYQLAHHIYPAGGFFGPVTRAAVGE